MAAAFPKAVAPWYQTVEESVRNLNSNVDSGLTEFEAAERLNRYGPNELPPPEETPFWKLVFKQFQDFLVLILLFAACVSFVLALLETDSDQKVTAFVEPFVILAILFVNAAVGVIQETNAERAILALKRYEASKAAVLRNSIWREVLPSDLVPGDIISLSTGSKVPADCRVCKLQTAVFSVDQSILTGECGSISKDEEAIMKLEAVDQDKTNMVFSGTLVTRGKAICMVVFTGSRTSLGTIWKTLQKDNDDTDTPKLEKHKSPLKEKLDEFGEMLSKMIFGVCVLVWLINIHHFTDRGGWIKGAIYYFKIAVALAVAAVPEGLPAVVTSCLALGAREMAKEHTLVRSLPAVETLGCTTVICADKTGTITANQMSVQKILVVTAGVPLVNILEFDVEDGGAIENFGSYTPKGNITSKGKVISTSNSLSDVAKIAALCNDSKLDYDHTSKKFTYLGEPTEAALRVLVEKIGVKSISQPTSSLPIEETDPVAAAKSGAPQDMIIKLASRSSTYWEKEHPLESVLEFTRERKSMSVICRSKSSEKKNLFCKGSPTSVLNRCDRIRLDSGGTAKLDDATKDLILKQIEKLGTQAYRCLALAQSEIPSGIVIDHENYESIESKMTFVGIVAMVDPPRPQVAPAIAKCQRAGMRVIICTGDDKTTAEAIARTIGLLKENDVHQSISGEQWARLDEQGKKDICLRLVVMHRVEPIHKLDLVQHLRHNGEVVAMTGDGVNDAPALRSADIGIGMGSGTAVAREASDMILADDNFATIVLAVRRGRAIFQNTKQFIRYLVSSNLGEVGCIFFSAALGIPESLLPVQLLWVNLVTDGLPATALGFNPPDPEVMDKKPRSRKAPIVDRWSFIRFAIVGTYVGCAVVMGFVWWFTLYENGPLIPLEKLRDFENCDSTFLFANGFDCNVFHRGGIDRSSTVALSILVFIEMLNAFNALSENQSLLDIYPWSNKYLLMAVGTSVTLHLIILYIPALNGIFGTAPLTFEEWCAVISFSAPVILVDEVLKFCTRRLPTLGASYRNVLVKNITEKIM